MRERRGAYGVFVEKPEGKRPRGGPGMDGRNILRMDLQAVGWEHGLDWSGSGH
jgi:hypothetical protein